MAAVADTRQQNFRRVQNSNPAPGHSIPVPALSIRPCSGWADGIIRSRGPGWEFCGVKLCFSAFLEASAISKRKCQKFLQSIKQGMVSPPEDGRTMRTHRDAAKADHARCFFQYLYDHLAEPLAEGEDDPEAEGDDLELHDEFSFFIKGEAAENPDLEVTSENPEGCKSDVFLLCKHFMHSTALTQKPTLLLPAERLQALGPAPAQQLSRNLFSERQHSEFRKTARQIALPPWNLTRASIYLIELCSNNMSQIHPLPPNLVFFNDRSESMRLREQARESAGPPEELLTFAPGTPKRVVVNLNAGAERARAAAARGRGQGRGRGRGRARVDDDPDPNVEVEPSGGAAVPGPPQPGVDAPVLPAAAPEEGGPGAVAELPPAAPKAAPKAASKAAPKAASKAAPKAASKAAPKVASKAAPKQGLKRPASAENPGAKNMIAAPSGKRYTVRVVDQQDKLGCNKCVYRQMGCSRCKEIHELWKARQS
eukprot:Skav210916  [mRNA]  locus=scaffold4127:33786:39501:+ [translate_table: standard]